MRSARCTAGFAALLCAAPLLFVAPGVTARAAAAPAVSAPAASAPLTNTAHLDSLLAKVVPPAQAGHTTYRLNADPSIGVLWVYANHNSDGSFTNVGGGNYDAATNTYGQGAYDADDIARAAVVYLRQWQQHHDVASRTHAEDLLRGLTYLQTASGPDAGNVVLWMQPDGSLNPTPTPPDAPNPSDSGASFWLARTIWALGEGYADLRGADPSFAGFLDGRMQLAIGALNREVLSQYPKQQVVHGKSVPAWLIGDGADASSEAVLGLSSYVNAGGGGTARRDLAELAEGISLLGSGNQQTWPYGALMPSATMPSNWHAWAAQMPAALAAASVSLRRPQLVTNAVRDAAVFTPHLLTTTGPSNGWQPAPTDNSQIAYGVDSRVRSLLTVARVTGSTGLRELAGIAAGWFFGSNNAGVPTYDPATGVARDGVSPDGVINQNSGAESTIHALLTMQALDANPDVRAIALRSTRLVSRDGTQTVEAEAAQLGGGATAVQPASAWTGEATYSGGKYVQLTTGSSLAWTVPASNQQRLVQAVVDRLPGGGGSVSFASGSVQLGTLALGGAGAQGAASAPDELVPVSLSVLLPAGATSLSATVSGGGGRLDAIQLSPLVSSTVYRGAGSVTGLFSSQALDTQNLRETWPGSTRVEVRSFDTHGRMVSDSFGAGNGFRVRVPAGGFAIASTSTG